MISTADENWRMVFTGLPLFLWHTEIAWKEVYTLAKKHPKLSLVVETQREKILYHMQTLLPLMRDCENVCVDTSNLAGQGYLEQVVRNCGANRVLYGSFFPVNDPSVSMGMLLDADIRQDKQRLIASGNLMYTDFAGDIFDLGLLESLANVPPSGRLLFGTDYPWLDPRANLERCMLVDIPTTVKESILELYALKLYGLAVEQR